MEQLKDKQAILNLIGKKSVLCFSFSCDSVLTYRSLIPKDIGGALFLFEVEVFLDSTVSEFFDFESLEDLTRNKQVFRVTIKELSGEREEIYYSKYKGNDN